MDARIPNAPPEWAFFEQPRPAAGTEALELRLGDGRLRVEGLDAPLAGALAGRYAPFAEPGAKGRTLLSIRLSRDPRDHFIEPPAKAERNPVLLDGDGRRFRYLGYRVAGRFDLQAGSGDLVLAAGEYEPAERAIENFLLASVAWLARREGGGLVHAAAAARGGKGYLFYGAAGAGKSTLAGSGAVRGIAISDDLSLVLPRRGGSLEIVPHPFRPNLMPRRPEERFPLAAGFRLVQGAEARVERVPRALAFAGLVANLPFVTDLLPRHPDLLKRIEADFAALPLAWLRFTRDDSFWDAIEAARF